MALNHLRLIFVFCVKLLLFSLGVSGQDQEQSTLHFTQAYQSLSHRIAIIGAGAGGSSAAYHIAKFRNETSVDIPIEIDIFESNSYIGGRSTTVNALDDPRYPTELGASIFVEVNHVVYNLSKQFGLSTRDGLTESTGALYDLGVWDGSSFLFTMANNDDDSWLGRFGGYWDIAKLLWKYGLSPIRTKNAKDTVVSRFLKMYDEFFPIASLTNFVSEVGLTEYTSIDGRTALLKNGVSEQFAYDVVQSSTRVNYAQNLDSIHGVETMVCMATDGAMSIDGGNWQIFDSAARRSGASIHLNTTVTDISKTSKGTYQIKARTNSHDPAADITKEYEAVVLAAPYQFSNITFTPPLPPTASPPPMDYVTLYVTLFTSPHRPSASFFGVSSQDEVPDSILTTLPPPSTYSSSNTKSGTQSPSRGTDAVGPAKFWSLSTLRTLNPGTDPIPASAYFPYGETPTTTNLTDKQYLYKIFSPAPLTATFLSSLFAFNDTHTHTSPSGTDNDDDDDEAEDPITLLPPHQLTWSHTKIWQSYPYLPPTTSFAATLLDSPLGPERVSAFNSQTKTTPSSADARGVFYTSGVEAFISTMETSALMGRNVAKILVDGLGLALSQ